MIDALSARELIDEIPRDGDDLRVCFRVVEPEMRERRREVDELIVREVALLFADGPLSAPRRHERNRHGRGTAIREVGDDQVGLERGIARVVDRAGRLDLRQPIETPLERRSGLPEKHPVECGEVCAPGTIEHSLAAVQTPLPAQRHATQTFRVQLLV